MLARGVQRCGAFVTRGASAAKLHAVALVVVFAATVCCGLIRMICAPVVEGWRGPSGRIDGVIGMLKVARGLGLTAAVCASVMASNAVHAEPMDEAVQALVDQHPQILAARQALEAARQNLKRERAPLLPQVNVTAGAGFEHTNSLATRQAGLENEQLFATNATLEVRQNLFNGFATYAGMNSAKALIRASDETLTAVSQNIVLEGVTAYLNVLRNRELVRLNTGNERAIREQLELEDERVSRGSGISVDVLLAKSRLQIAREQSLAFDGAFKDSLSTYRQVFGGPPELDQMTALAPTPAMLPESQEAAAKKIEKDNPIIRIAYAQADSAKAERRRAQSGYYPVLDLVGSANIENNLAGVEDVRRDFSIKLEATWALFDGLLTPANTAEAGARYQEAIQSGRDVTRRTIELMEISWHEMEVARERANLLRNAMNIAGEVFQSRVELREAGKETAINVLDAENELYSACINFVNAFYDSQIAAFRVLNTLGQLDAQTVAQSQPVEESAVVGQCGFSAAGDGSYRAE
ncbi:MAG: TolC family protein [Minwuia sp.]|uniref:TolC family protein n=1 Tax=Minwuia sp. TaxID=2493630 RepID=UPI003A847B9F